MSQIWYPVETAPSSFSGGSDGKASAYTEGNPGSIPGSGRSPGEGNGNLLPVFLPGESYGCRSLVGYISWGRKESDTTEHTITHVFFFMVSERWESFSFTEA